MLFKILKSSYSGSVFTPKPVEEAELRDYIATDVRPVDDPKKINPELSPEKWWYGIGFNHRVEDGKIKREIKKSAWFVEIKDLEELIRFIEKYGGSCVIEKSQDSEYFVIRIIEYPEISEISLEL
jgi:dissimilatory sulfite reductase (desulfoviridin) alpha/beta subunit